MRRTIAVALASLGLILGIAVPQASATTGGMMWNTPESQSVVYVYNVQYPTQTSNYSYVQVGYVSSNGYNVTGFRLPYHCKGRSQYSPAGSWPYAGTVIYRYSQNNLGLDLTTTCW